MYTIFKYHFFPAFLGRHDGRGLPSVNVDKAISFRVTLLIMFVIQYIESVYFVSKFKPEIVMDSVGLIVNFIAIGLNLVIQVWLGKAVAKEKEVLLYHFFFISIAIEIILIIGYYFNYVIPRAFLISWVLVAMYSNYKSLTNRLEGKNVDSSKNLVNENIDNPNSVENKDKDKGNNNE